jgi:hypothetical protein
MSFVPYTASAAASHSRYGPSRVINPAAVRVATINIPSTKLYEPVESNPIPISKGPGGVSDLDPVSLNPEDSQYVKATYVHI